MIIRQGDVGLLAVEVDDADLGAEVPREGGRIVLAHGEATGHAHAVSHPKARMFRFLPGRDAAVRKRHGLAADVTIVGVVRTPVRAYVDHEEHDRLELPGRSTLVIRQRVYTPEAIRDVAD